MEKELYHFWWAWNFDISYETCGYFDNRPRINLGLFFFHLTLIIPIRNSWTDECDPPKWGIAYHNQTFWIYRGGKGNDEGGNKWWTFYMPWSYTWVRTSNLRIDGKWENETQGDRKNFYEDKWREIIKNETFPYKYVCDSGTVQDDINATIKTTEMEWRQRWLKWTKLFAKVSRSIDVSFDNEVGSERGSWKGGTIGCSYTLKVGETPYDCLKRMERERRFERH